MRARVALTLWQLRRRRLARATLLLGLLSLVAMALPLRPHIRPSQSVVLPGVPLGMEVDTATHSVVLTTANANRLLTIPGPGGAPRSAVTYPDGEYGTAVAVDPVTGYVYIAGTRDRIVVFASPVSSPVAAIDLDQPPVALAVNPTTGRVYVATRFVGSDTATAELFVLDGPRLVILSEIVIGHGLVRLAVDATTNRLFATDDDANTLTALDGATNAILGTMALGAGRHDLAVNALTGRVYVSSDSDHSIAVLDGPHMRLLEIDKVAGTPGPIGVDERLDRVYVATSEGTMLVLDGKTDRLLATVAVGAQPSALAVDATINRVYVADSTHGTVWLLQDGRFRHPSVRLIAFAGGTGGPKDQQHEQCGC